LTLHQIEAFAIVAGMLALFVSDRLRYDVVGTLALSAAILTGVVPAEHAFGCSSNPVIIIIASVLVISRAIAISGVVEAVMRPLLRWFMLGCLIPAGESLRDTGATGLIASGLSHLAAQLPGPFAVGLILVASMLITLFLHHAAAVLVMGPVAAAVADDLGFGPDAFLMAVALGPSCDFLTPIGHQNNTLVMGPGGYRFSNHWRLGLPLSCMVATVGTWLIIYTWPLHP
jgi:di/tricarboxylate transporter